MKDSTSLTTKHLDLKDSPISLLDEVITHSNTSVKGICKLIVIKATEKGLRVASPQRLIGDWEPLGDFRYPSTLYVVGPFVPPDIQFIQNVNIVKLRLLMLEAWELRNNIGVV